MNPFPDGNVAGYTVYLRFDLTIDAVGTGDDYDALDVRLCMSYIFTFTG